MNNTPRFYFLKKKLSRPNTARSLSTAKTQHQLSLEVKAKKISPLSRIPKLIDIGTSPMVFEQDIKLENRRKKIVVVKTPKDLDESPSMLISEDIVKQYTKNLEPQSTKKPCPLSFLAIPLPPSAFNRKRPSQGSNSSRIHINLLKKSLNLKNQTQKPARLFDYNEIVSISHANIRLK